MMRKYPFAPHPFVPTPPIPSSEASSTLRENSVEIVLIGRSVEYLPYFIYTFENMGRQGIGNSRVPFHVLRVESMASPIHGNSTIIYENGGDILAPGLPCLAFDALKSACVNREGLPEFPELAVKMLTPIHVVTAGREDSALECNALMQSLLRRIKLLHEFFCRGPENYKDFGNDIASMPPAIAPNGSFPLGALDNEPIEPKDAAVSNDGIPSAEVHRLLSLADQVKTVHRELRWTGRSRRSGHTGKPMTLSGYLGEVRYRFPSVRIFCELLPYLRLGEWIHAGKHTSFGFGKYELSMGQLWER
jgi:hypothetical protein